jgi:predicted glycosyltransferase
MGHMRRNALLAQSLATSLPRPVILMIAGSRQAGALPLPDGVDQVTLPALRKEGPGSYRARHLDVSLDEIVALRAETIRVAVECFCPALLIVDNVPRGALGELDPTLELLRARGTTRCVLGLRDVLDQPAVVKREWLAAGNQQAIRDYYDAVWVYGDRRVFDVAREYGFDHEVTARLRYTGYLDQRQRVDPGVSQPICHDGPRRALCLVGGGEDGLPVARAFACADLGPDTVGLLVTGPFMPREAVDELRRIATTRPRLEVVEYLAEPVTELMRADRVVAMGGYNTVCEILSFGKRALIVPREAPRAEQWLRAKRLESLGLLDVLPEREVGPAAIAAWLADGRPVIPAGGGLDFRGLSCVPRLAAEEMARGSSVPLAAGAVGMAARA